MTHPNHYVIQPPLGGFVTGKGLWTPSADDALWQTVTGGAYWHGIIGNLGVQFRVLVASSLGTAGGDFLYDDPAALYDTATYSNAEISWFDITSAVKSFAPQRGRQHLGTAFNAGTMGITFNNDSGLFNPQRGVALIGNQTLRPGRVIGIQGRRTDEEDFKPLWVGRIDSLGDVYQDAAHKVDSTWSCSGFFTLLSADAPAPLEVADPATAGQLTGARIEYIWGLEGYNTDLLDADPGTNTLQATTFPGSRLSQMQSAERAEGGYLFEAKNGVITFRDQNWLDFSNPVATILIGQEGQDLQILDAKTSWDIVRVSNNVEMQAEGGLPQKAQNTTSQALYGVRTILLTGLENDSDVDVFDLAELAIERNSFDSLRLDEVDVWAQDLAGVNTLLDMEIGQTVQVQVNAKDFDYTIVAFVQGVQHIVTHKDWHTRLRLDNAFRGNPLLAGAYSNAYSSAYNRLE